MEFQPGDRVHVAGLGTGTVVDVRNRGRYGVAVKGRTLVVDGTEMQSAGRAPRKRTSAAPAEGEILGRADAAATIDLHGKTVAEALEALDAFVNDALLASLAEVRVIHGRSGGRIREAVHKRLRRVAAVRSFRLDPLNPGVTIISL